VGFALGHLGCSGGSHLPTTHAEHARQTQLTFNPNPRKKKQVARLNLNLQRRLDNLEAKVDRAAQARAGAEAKAAAATRGEQMWEREAGVMTERLHVMDSRVAALEKTNAALRGQR
jgi:hypothetical protein